MGGFLVATGAILTTWIIIIFGLTCLGLLVRRIYGSKQINTNDLIISFWVGFAIALCIGQIWNLFLPADGRLWLIILFLAIADIVWSRQQLGLWLGQILIQWKSFLVFGIIFIGLSVEIAWLAAHSIPVHDTGSYHLPATLWMHTYALVPGLSNLHSRLGFNSSLFVYAASMSDGIWANRPYYVMMGPLILIAYVPALVGIKRIFTVSGDVHLTDFLASTFIFPVYYMYHWRNYASSLAPNGVIFLLVLIGTWMTLIGVSRKNNTINPSGYVLFATSLLFVASITIKLTIAPFAALMWLIVVVKLFKSDRIILKAVRYKAFAWMLVSAFLLVGPWLARGSILSGYPLYPVTIGGLNVDWRVPKIQAELDAGWTRSYSRACYDAPPKSFEWVIPWAKNLFKGKDKLYDIIFPVLITIGAGLFIFLLMFIKGWPKIFYLDIYFFWIVISVIFSLVVWFFTAPDPRFGMGLLWLLACLSGSIVLNLIWLYPCRVLKIVVLGSMSVLLFLLVIGKVRNVVSKVPDSKYLTRVGNPDMNFTELLNEGLSPLPVVKMWKYTTSAGLQINVPVEGNQIWDAPLLSSPHPSPGLMLRDPEDLSAGFRQEGQWRPYGYPILIYPWHNYVKKRLDEKYGQKKNRNKQ